MSDLRQMILAAKDDREELVTVPEWGDVVVLVRTMIGTERAKFINMCVKKDGTIDPEKGYADLVIRTAYDPKSGKKAGNGDWLELPTRIFQPTDRDALMAKNGTALERITMVALRINGFTEAARQQAALDLNQARNGDSTSTLPTDIATAPLPSS